MKRTILLATGILCITFLIALWLHGRQNRPEPAPVATAPDPDLRKLEAAIAQPKTKPTDWLAYGQSLQNLKRFREAAWAYQQVLKESMQPENRKARLQVGICLAIAGLDAAGVPTAMGKEEFAAFLWTTAKLDPRLTVEILDRPEGQPYRSDKVFREIWSVVAE